MGGARRLLYGASSLDGSGTDAPDGVSGSVAPAPCSKIAYMRTIVATPKSKGPDVKLQ